VSGPPRISVVVPTYQRRALLERCLVSLVRQTLPRREFEVVVVDDGSSDGTAEIANAWRQWLPLEVARQRNCGPSPARNLGILMARAPIVLLFDDDESAHEDLLASHLRAHERFPELTTGILGHTGWSPGLPLTPLMHYVTEVGQFLLSYPSVPRDQPLEFSYFWTGRLSAKRDLFTQYGLFSPALRRLEDIELGWRLSRHGLQMRYWPEARSYRETAVAFDDFCQRMETDGAAIIRLRKFHPGSELEGYLGLADAAELWRQDEPHLEGWIAAARALERELAELPAPFDDPRFAPLWELYRRCFLAHRHRGAAAELARA
jgi:glycosyltransferase involved in cell wall biosynthesis